MNVSVPLKDRQAIAEGTMSFSFERPVGFRFVAGQYVDISLVNPPQTDVEGNTRSFSIASAPYEKDIMVATRMRDTDFKRVLKELPLGSKAMIDGPFGSFTLHHNVTKPAVFLIGGIGITPVRSILLNATRVSETPEIHLFYSNRRPEDTTFLRELMQFQAINKHYHFIGTMTNVTESHLPWSGETGYIDVAMLRRYIHDITQPIYYIAGPPAMVAALRQMLEKAKVDSDQIRIEEFAGY